ncbi:MAG TPA: DUF1553 domain-containing protein [Candidatus Acidoferrales bacterium]|nr:DUF1553 domain-containing protein [Candidatus Acidoferrales bacterium]
MRTFGFALLLFAPASLLSGAERMVEFNRDIRPILSDKCLSCHGIDATAKKIPLRLDSEAAAKADLGGRRAIVEGDPVASQMVKRITAESKAVRMPPVYSGLKLTDGEIETLRTWIAQGARWQKHWAFIPPVRPELPAVKTQGWVRNPIDAFVLARLEREGLTPSPEADRETLLRRVSLDLTGLPQTVGEMDAFANDRSAGAYEKVVDRLLASPRYGERMAERWLDAARYADTNGYQFDGERVMWRWRDWVIDAFNRNQRFDQFALEQIAGDLLPNATLDQKIATGFNRNHRANTEDGIIPEEYAVEYVVDRVETTSTVFLGVTLGCARCHNHKYDPFTQKEFYQVFAYFNNVPEMGRAMKYGNSPPLIPAPTADQQAALAALEHKIHKVEDGLPKTEPKWEAPAGKVYWTPSTDLKASFPLDSADELKMAGGTVTFGPGRIGNAATFDGKGYLDAGTAGDFDIEDRFSLAAWVYSDDTPNGAVVTKMVDTAKGKGYGVYLNNGKVDVHVTSVWEDDAIRLETDEALAAKRWYQLTVTYDGSRMAAGVHVYIDARQAEFKVDQDTLYRPFRNAGKSFSVPFRLGGGGGPERRFRGSIDDVRVYSRVLDAQEIAALALGESVEEIAAKPQAARSEIERLQLRWYYLEHMAPPDLQQTWKGLIALQQEKDRLERRFPTVMVMAERPVRNPTFVLARGAYDKPGEKVEPGVPAVLSPGGAPGLSNSPPNGPANSPPNRLGFARWMTDPSNPLMARVTMNRFWEMYFGTGIVKTVEDFGVQGEWPSHPELLDWLATEFIGSGWDVKAMLKLIVTSAAYRQSSKVSPELQQRDPENRLLARGARFRLPAEMVRDQALAVSGLLVEKVGGPSVKPYQPAGLWKDLVMQDMQYVESKGDDLHRRSLYTFWKRTIAPPMMLNFDSANREACVVRESRTNTPLQALDLMNDVQFLEAARLIGQRMMKEGGNSADARLRYGFRLVTGRRSAASEADILQESLRYHLDYFSDKKDEIREFLEQGEARTDPGLDQRELAAYTSVASLLLNMDETVTRQ